MKAFQTTVFIFKHEINDRLIDYNRTKLYFPSAGSTYRLQIPVSRGVALPGFYLLFALSANGVPSIGRFIRIGALVAPPPSSPPPPLGQVSAFPMK